MSDWRELEVAALLGSQKHTVIKHWPTPELAAIAAQLPSGANNLLSQLALMSVYQRAGQQASSVPNSAVAETENGVYASATLRQHLHFVLSQDGQEYLHDWLLSAGQRRILLPRTSLPTLLRLGENNKKWRLALGQAVAKRGLWLAQQNPDWAWVTATQFDLHSPELDHYWQSASLACRELLFERLRAADPVLALTFLQRIWAEENANTRKLLVEKLAVKLSMADQDFLESCLDDRSKAVKDAAIELLRRLPASALFGRMQQTCMQVLTIKKGMVSKTLVIHPLDQITAELERDGLEVKPKKTDNLGEKAQWLRDIMASVSLDWLSSYCQLDATTLLAKILDNEWASALCRGLISAAIQQQHQQWLLALLAVDDLNMPVAETELLAALAAPAREQWLLRQLSAAKTVASALKTIIRLLQSLPMWPWSTEFTLKLLESCQRLQNSGALSYELERQVLPPLLTLIGRYGAAELVLSPNQYPPQIVSIWQLRVQMAQALTDAAITHNTTR